MITKEVPKEDGMNTIRQILAEENFDVMKYYPVVLECAELISIQGHEAVSIMVIFKSLCTDHQKKMNEMPLLFVLHVYMMAIQDKILTPPQLNLTAGKFDLNTRKSYTSH